MPAGSAILLYDAQHRNAEAEPLFKRALAIKEKALGSDHLEVAVALHDLAKLCQKLSRLSEAEPLFKRALSIAEGALGPEHPWIATVLRDLTDLYLAQSRHVDADALAKRTHAIREKVSGATQPNHNSQTEDPADLLLHVKSHGCRFCARCKPFPDGALLFDHCSKFGFEGVV